MKTGSASKKDMMVSITTIIIFLTTSSHITMMMEATTTIIIIKIIKGVAFCLWEKMESRTTITTISTPHIRVLIPSGIKTAIATVAITTMPAFMTAAIAVNRPVAWAFPIALLIPAALMGL